MSWDRVIQDSDEEEPFVDDENSTSIAPIQGHEPPQYNEPCDHPADQHTNHASEQMNTPEVQLGVDFDQFLQSQGTSKTSVTASQQRREEMWIPPTGDGGESIGTGAMMTEIGLAQQRLFDDDGSSAGQNHSMSTTYPSGISEPGSFPMHYDQHDNTRNIGSTGLNPNILHEPTQLVAPHTTTGYQYSTPADSSRVDSPITNTDDMNTVATSARPYDTATWQTNTHKPAQRSKSMHSEWNSPHDTEPNSSVRSPQVNRSKSDHGQTTLISPHSPASTHDELSTPAFEVEIAAPDIASIVKRRGRPKKQPAPQYDDDDDDDELAMNHDSEPVQVRTEKRRPGRPSKQDKTAQQANKASPDDGPAVVEASGQVAQQPKSEPKKKKAKRSKTAPEPLKSKSKLDEDDDDVIWVESRPLEMENANTKANGNNETKEATNISEGDSNETKLVSNESAETPAPAPKKRGRKRKKTTEQEVEHPPHPPATSEDIQPGSKNEDPLIPETKEQDTPIVDPPKDAEEDTTLAKQSESESTPQPDQPAKHDAAEAAPQTPQLAKPRKVHSPISSTSKVPYRIGLSKRARIAPLLKVVRK